MSQLLRARRILTEQGWLDDHQLRIESSAVAAIEPIPAGVTTRLYRHARPRRRWRGRHG